MSLHVGMYTQVQLPKKARGYKSPGTGVTGSCEPPDTGAGSQTPNLSALSSPVTSSP